MISYFIIFYLSNYIYHISLNIYNVIKYSF